MPANSARELYPWRDDGAVKADQPPFKIVGPEVLLAVPEANLCAVHVDICNLTVVASASSHDKATGGDNGDGTREQRICSRPRRVRTAGSPAAVTRDSTFTADATVARIRETTRRDATAAASTHRRAKSRHADSRTSAGVRRRANRRRR
jgi:hypothetical protein